MGNLLTHTRENENVDASGNAYFYYYPPKNGKFFGTNFIMGGDKFDMSQPESYLFGENNDLNYISGRPNPFPYSAPLPGEPMQMLRAMINIRKETIKLVNPPADSKDVDYSLEFTLDSDVDCAITLYFQCKEEITSTGVKYITKQFSETFYYKAGIGQQFSETSPTFNPLNYGPGELFYNVIDDKGDFNPLALFPIVIHCVAELGDVPRQSHSLIASFEKIYDNLFAIKPLKQKIFVDGLSYLLQEIYGIENKTSKRETTSSESTTRTSSYDEESDNSFECVICMSDLRDTLILPCRHLCLCYNCANSLRYQANNCPICRVPFRALLQIKAVRKNISTLMTNSGTTDTFNDVIIDIPPGFETISLVEALNGINPRISINSDVIVARSNEIDGQLLTAEERRVDSNFSKILPTKEKTKEMTTLQSDDVTINLKSNDYGAPGIEDNGSASSSSSSSSSTSGTIGAVSLQEKTRLLTSSNSTKSTTNVLGEMNLNINSNKNESSKEEILSQSKCDQSPEKMKINKTRDISGENNMTTISTENKLVINVNMTADSINNSEVV